MIMKYIHFANEPHGLVFKPTGGFLDYVNYARISSYKTISNNGKDVTIVKFEDDKEEKMVRSNDDPYDIRKCLLIAITKHCYKEGLTFEGIEWAADQLKHYKWADKIVTKAIKEHEKQMKAEAKDKLEAEQKKAANKAKAEQLRQHKIERLEKLDQDRKNLIEDIAKAVKAMN